MSEHSVTLITAPTQVAEQIAVTLVEERLAACVNIIEKVRSVYWWQGQTEKADEALLVVKGMTAKMDELIARVREIHPYEIPEVISLDIQTGNKDYLDWLSGKEVVIDDIDLDDEDIAEEEEEK
ncbi:MAG: divalent-cation tolerance protein CutA [candidate division Zixibacteria bacterium]|nr:divalent-cation tolerance protein CutA [candidate division Zixibacteria bacterium]